MEWLGQVDINEVIRELLALKASNEELAKRVMRLELEVEALVGSKQDRRSVRYLSREEG